MNEEARETIGIKLRPSIVRKARVRAASSDKKLAEWLEEAIEEKPAREKRNRAKIKRPVGAGLSGYEKQR